MNTQVSNSRRTKLFLAAGAIGCALFIVTFLIEGAVRPGYDPLRYPISSLSIGEFGWIQVTNFIVTGLLLLAASVGMQQSLALEAKEKSKVPMLLALVGIGLIGAGFFSTDPIYGYPATGPLLLAQFSWHGHLHDLFSILVFTCLPIACFVSSRRFRMRKELEWAGYSLFTGIAMTVLFILAAMGFKQFPGFANFAGVFQRSTIIVGWMWVALIGVHFIRKSKVVMP